MKNSFYRPHARVQQNNELVNPVTGEITYPASRTKQEFVKECDINNILKQYSKTGMLNHISAKAAMGAYTDLPDPCDLQDAMTIVQASNETFMGLPSKLRDRFGNDPIQFLAFMDNPANTEEFYTLGLAVRPVGPISAPTGTTGGEGGTPPSEGAKAP